MASTTRKRRKRGAPDRSMLLQLMGFPKQGTVSVTTVRPDWMKVIERLSTHPQEAAMSNPTHFDQFIYDMVGTWTNCPLPLILALMIRNAPVTVEALDALIEAHPAVVKEPRSNVVASALGNPALRTNHEIIDKLVQANPTYLCGLERTRAFQIMGFPRSHHEMPVMVNIVNMDQVNWPDFEEYLQNHPEEAKILCCPGELGRLIFPLEAAVQFENPPPPLSTVQLLLTLCPEAAEIQDSAALYMACFNRKTQDPEVIRSILRTNPAAAASMEYYWLTYSGHRGLPIHEAVHLTCAAEILPDLIQANPQSLSVQSKEHDLTPLEVAARDYNLPTNVLRILLENGHRYDAGAPTGQLFYVSDYFNKTAMDHIVRTAILYRVDWESGFNLVPWQNYCLAIQAAGAFRTRLSADEMWGYPLLHAVIEFGERWCAFDRIFGNSTLEDLNRVDALGRTPLGVAIEMAGKKIVYDEDYLQSDVVLEQLLDDQRGGSSQSASIPMATQHRGAVLPLHEALQLGLCLEDGLDHILDAFPGALSIADPMTKLLPCLLSAVGKGARVDTVFALMIKRPNLIASLCQANAREYRERPKKTPNSRPPGTRAKRS